MIDLGAFLLESNKIEGITGFRDRELDEAEAFLSKSKIEVGDLQAYVKATAPGAVLRDKVGLNVQVGNHVPPPGGINILTALNSILDSAMQYGIDPYRTHRDYENLHPFTDGNGCSGRLLWLWQMTQQGKDVRLGFLHRWYYQSLEASRG